jgi:hypothetical protein
LRFIDSDRHSGIWYTAAATFFSREISTVTLHWHILL